MSGMPQLDTAPVIVPIVEKLPNQDRVSQLLKTIFSAEKAQSSLDAAYELSELVCQTAGVNGLQQYAILGEVKKAATDKKNPARREGSMFLLGALIEKFVKQQPLSEVVFLCANDWLLPLALDTLADKVGTVRESSQYAVDALFSHMRPEALLEGLLPNLLKYLATKSGKWQGTVGAYKLLNRLATRNQKSTASNLDSTASLLLLEGLGNRLEALIPFVEEGMHDLKTEVCSSAYRIYIF